MFLEDTGIVLRAQPYQERDRLVTLLTENHGKLTGVARGAIHSRRFGGAFDLFTCIEFRAKDSPSQGLVHIDSASIRRDFLSIRERLENMSAAGYFTDLCLRLSEERQSARELFLLLAHYFFLLEQEGATHEIVRSFELKLLDRLGYGPNLDNCVACEKSLDQPQAVWATADRGGFLCLDCGSAQLRAVESHTLAWLRAARTCSIQNTKELKFPPNVTREGAALLMQFLRYHCPGLGSYEFRSHQLLEQFLEQSQ